jgi:hypothetical protein
MDAICAPERMSAEGPRVAPNGGYGRGWAKAQVALRDRPSPSASALGLRSSQLPARLPGLAGSRARAAALGLARGVVHAEAVPLPALGAVLMSALRQPGFSPAG